MFHHKKTKYKFLRKYFLPISAIVFLLGAVIFWYNIFLQSPQKNTKINLQKSFEEEKFLEKDFDQRLNQVMNKFSCEAKSEKLVKGFIKKINKDYLIISDQGDEKKIYFKPETIFLRVYIDGRQEDIFEIKREDLQINTSVVVSAFEDTDNTFTLLVKQIIENQDETRS